MSVFKEFLLRMRAYREASQDYFQRDRKALMNKYLVATAPARKAADAINTEAFSLCWATSGENPRHPIFRLMADIREETELSFRRVTKAESTTFLVAEWCLKVMLWIELLLAPIDAVIYRNCKKGHPWRK